MIAEMVINLTEMSNHLIMLLFYYVQPLMGTLAQEWDYLQDEGFLLRLLVAAFCGALVGLEREMAEKPAGLRTNIMICVGSCLFTIASILSYTIIANASPQVDPGRIAAQVVTGVGFIGAGVIIRTGLQVTGLTTASTIWCAASVGIIVGMGFPLLGIITTISLSLMLFVLGRFH